MDQLFYLLIFVCFGVRSAYVVFLMNLLRKLASPEKCSKEKCFPLQVHYQHLMPQTIVLNIV